MVRWPLGDDIELRLFEESHAAELFDEIERNRTRLRRWLPWVDKNNTVEDVRNFIRTALEAFVAGDGLHLGVWIGANLSGGIGYRKIDPVNRSTSIGYWLDAAAEGKGVMTRCCRAMLEHLFEKKGLHRVEIRCAPANTRSCAIPARLGFTREGVSREAECVGGEFHDLVVWSMLEQEWKKDGR